MNGTVETEGNTAGWKIVDMFNGHEYAERYDTKDLARSVLAVKVQKFFARTEHANARCMLNVVSAGTVWKCDPITNEDVWE